MKKYLHFIAAAGILIPFLASAEVLFSMAPIACPSPSVQKKWSFFQLTESKDTGICTAYFAAGGEGFEVKNWQSSNYLNAWDLRDYTVGAGMAACQKAACTLHVGSGAGAAAGTAFSSASVPAPSPSLTPAQARVRDRVLGILGRSVAPSAPVAAYSAIAPVVRSVTPSVSVPTPAAGGYPAHVPTVRAGVMAAPPASYYATGWMNPKPIPKCDAATPQECRRDAFEVQGNSMGMPKNTCQWVPDSNNSNGGVCRTVQLPAQ